MGRERVSQDARPPAGFGTGLWMPRGHPHPAAPSASAPGKRTCESTWLCICPSPRGRRPCKAVPVRPSVGSPLGKPGAGLACLCPHVRGRVRGAGGARPS